MIRTAEQQARLGRKYNTMFVQKNIYIKLWVAHTPDNTGAPHLAGMHKYRHHAVMAADIVSLAFKQYTRQQLKAIHTAWDDDDQYLINIGILAESDKGSNWRTRGLTADYRPHHKRRSYPK